MESEERPAKVRKLSHEGTPGSASTTEVEISSKANMQTTVQQPDGAEASEYPTSGTHDPKSEPGDGSDDVEDELDKDPEGHLPPPSETAPLADSGEVDTSGPPMSKNQQKKLRKKQEWEAKREDRKAVRKEKLTAKRERKREARQNAPPPPPEEESKKKPKPPKPVTLPVTFLIDCDFDNLMRDNERISLAAQITRSYSDNKNSLFRAHLAVCSFNKKLRDRFDNVLGHYKGWRGVRFLDEDFVDAAEKAKTWMQEEAVDAKKLVGSAFAPAFSTTGEEASEEVQAKLQSEGEVVYLSSESPYTLTALKPYSTYIIGGLVDKNREKGICYKRAVQKGVKTARLPIGEFMEMQSRKVLATNHVNEIMLRWLDCGDWGKAFLDVIPKRKGGKLKDGEHATTTKDVGSENEAEGESDGNDVEEDAGSGNEDGGVSLKGAEDNASGHLAPSTETGIDRDIIPQGD